MGKLLSVIIPIHNKASTLPRVIDSIKAQELPTQQFEVIFVVDNSSDQSSAILRAIPENFNQNVFEILEIVDNLGSAAKARNYGIGLSKGEFCLFLDSDIEIQPDFFARISNYLRGSEKTVFLAPVYGNSSSLSIWPFLVKNHVDWASMNNTDLFKWAEGESRIQDFRIEFANPTDGSLDHLPAPWVFCWSSAMVVERTIIKQVGGFNDSFDTKGSEDLEFGYRLHRAGLRFRLMRETYVFHLPHIRNRDAEEGIDRFHEREMLRMYPTREMEALCAFDGSHANDMLKLLKWFDSNRLQEIAMIWETPINVPGLGLPRDIPLIIGPPSSWLVGNVKYRHVVWPQTDTAYLSLFGFSLPFQDKSFPAAVVFGIWQILPERLGCRIINEALRVAEKVYLIKDIRSKMPIPNWPSGIIETHTRPYWERTNRLCSSFYDFVLQPLGEDSWVSSFRVDYSKGSLS